MSQYFPCPECGAQYTTDQVAPGTVFSCGACGAQVTAPDAPAVVAPTAAPAAAPAAEAPAPSMPPAGARRKPAGSRAAAGKPAAGRRPAAGKAAGRKAAPAARKSGPNPLLLVGGGVGLLIVVIVVLAMPSGDPSTGGGEDNGQQQAAVEKIDAKQEFAKLKEELTGQHDASEGAEQTWALGLAYLAAADAVEGKTLEHRELRNLLTKAAVRAKNESVELDPDFLPYHEERGNRKYSGELEEFIEASYLLEGIRKRARKAHERLLKDTKKGGGWAAKSKFKTFDTLMAEIEPQRAKRDELESTPWFAKARELESKIIGDVDERFAKQPSVKFPGLMLVAVPPYAIFIEKDRGWDPKDEALRVIPRLKEVEDTIRAEWKGIVDIEPIEGPVPILYFRNQRNYNVYATEGASTGGMGALAHFEPDTGRVALHLECKPSTLKHEATHQVLFAVISRAAGDTVLANSESFWFHEGMAEWYAVDGKLQAGRLTYLDNSTDEGRKNLFTVREMLDLSYADRARMPGRILNVYSQAWFFIFYLNWFNVDADGYVDPNKPGIYREQWKKFVRAKIEAKGRGLDLFKEQTGFTDADLDRMEREYWRFCQYVKNKLALKQYSENKLVRWDEYVNKRGLKTGEKDDDKLPAYDPSKVPLREDEK